MESALKEIAERVEHGAPLDGEHSSEDLKALYGLAYTLYEAGSYSEAKGIFQELASSQPFTGSYWMGLGACAQMEEEYDEALKAWAMAALIDGSAPMPHFHASECYLALGNLEEGAKAKRAAESRLEKGGKFL